MKLIKILVIVFITGLVTAGCKKILNQAPNNAITDAVSFASPDRCLLVLHGVYDAAQSGFYAGSYAANRGYPFGAANIEQGDARGEDVVNIAAFYQITYEASYNPTTANNVNMWATLYALINRANVGIDGFTKASGGVLTAAVASQYIAECRYLRAMAHHEALIHFARPYRDGNGQLVGIPYRDFPVNTPEAVTKTTTTPRMRIDSVYANILADLDFAEANLPAAKNVIRATKATAIALKMRVKLHMGDWAGVITEGNKLVPATVTPLTPTSVVSPIGGYSLTAQPDGPFASNTSNEAIFSIKNDPLDNPGTNAALSRMYGATPGGRGLVSISPIIWNNTVWKCDDKRRTQLYALGANANNTQSIFTNKYRDYSGWGDYAPQFRYAEVLLMLAEAEARANAGVSARGVDLLNVVRNRSLVDPATDQYTVAGFASKNALITAILWERRIEFLAEGKRWGDIHRNAKDPDFTTGGIPAKASNGVANPATGTPIFGCGTPYTPGQAAIPYTDFKFIWPIPSDEVSQNPVIKQNPDY
jgi:hypothetical protein